MPKRIDELDATVLPTTGHEFPSMKDGLTVKLSVAQVIALANAAQTFDSVDAMLNATSNVVGQKAVVDGDQYSIVAAGTYTTNPVSVLDLIGVSGQAVALNPTFADRIELETDTRPIEFLQGVFGATGKKLFKTANNCEFGIDLAQVEEALTTTASGVKVTAEGVPRYGQFDNTPASPGLQRIKWGNEIGKPFNLLLGLAPGDAYAAVNHDDIDADIGFNDLIDECWIDNNMSHLTFEGVMTMTRPLTMSDTGHHQFLTGANRIIRPRYKINDGKGPAVLKVLPGVNFGSTDWAIDANPAVTNPLRMCGLIGFTLYGDAAATNGLRRQYTQGFSLNIEVVKFAGVGMWSAGCWNEDVHETTILDCDDGGFVSVGMDTDGNTVDDRHNSNNNYSNLWVAACGGTYGCLTALDGPTQWGTSHFSNILLEGDGGVDPVAVCRIQGGIQQTTFSGGVISSPDGDPDGMDSYSVEVGSVGRVGPIEHLTFENVLLRNAGAPININQINAIGLGSVAGDAGQVQFIACKQEGSERFLKTDAACTQGSIGVYMPAATITQNTDWDVDTEGQVEILGGGTSFGRTGANGRGVELGSTVLGAKLELFATKADGTRVNVFFDPETERLQYPMGTAPSGPTDSGLLGEVGLDGSGFHLAVASDTWETAGTV